MKNLFLASSISVVAEELLPKVAQYLHVRVKWSQVITTL